MAPEAILGLGGLLRERGTKEYHYGTAASLLRTQCVAPTYPTALQSAYRLTHTHLTQIARDCVCVGA